MMLHVAEGTFDAEGFDLRFARDDDGTITGLGVFSGRSSGVWFGRE